MEMEFKTLSMMELRNSPGDILDRVYKQGEAFIIERSGQHKACLVPVSHFFPDIPKSKVNEVIEEIRQMTESPTLRFSETKELEILFKNIPGSIDITLKIVLPHGYPNAAPRVYASPIRADTPHCWQDGALCIFGTVTSWNPGKHNLTSILNLSKEWLSRYENWSKTGKWPKPEGKL